MLKASSLRGPINSRLSLCLDYNVLLYNFDFKTIKRYGKP